MGIFNTVAVDSLGIFGITAQIGSILVVALGKHCICFTTINVYAFATTTTSTYALVVKKMVLAGINP